MTPTPFPARHSSTRSEFPPEEIREPPSGVLEKVLTGGLLAGLVLLLLAGADSLLAFRGPLAQAGTGVLWLLLAICGGFRDAMPVALRRGPNPFIAGLAVWSLVAFFVAPYRAPAAADLLRVWGGVAAFYVAAYALPSSRSVIRAATGLVVIGCALALTDFARLGAGGGVTTGFQYSFFATHEDVGSLMLLLVPLALAVFVTPETGEKARLPAFAATLLLVIALLLTRCRSAWIGEIVALAVFFVLRAVRAARSQAAPRVPRAHGQDEPLPLSPREGIRRLLASPALPALLLIGGVLLFVSLSGAATVFRERAQSAVVSLTDSGESIGTRLEMWDGAARMASEKPVTGWGLGSYLVMEGRWTHLGDDPATVLTHGGTHFNIAHDYYVHWAADAGGVGLFLYVAAVAAVLGALVSGYVKGARLPPLQSALALGAASALAGSLVDALGSPSYNFHGVYALWWTIAGLGVASLRSGARERSDRNAVALGPTSRRAWAGTITCGLLAVGAVLGTGWGLRAQGDTVGRGVLHLVTVPAPKAAAAVAETPTPPPASASANEVIEAVYTDATGHDLPTAPGTRWRVLGLKKGEVALRSERAIPQKSGITLRRATMTIPKGSAGRVRVEALYKDRYSRTYRAAYP